MSSLDNNGNADVISRKRLDLDEVRSRLAGRRGRELWRSLDELAATPEFEQLVHREFPQQASEWRDGVDRRRFLQLMSASLAFGGLTACTRQPLEKIVPYVKQPEEIVPGKPLFFATGMTMDGYGVGLLAESHMGRPTKLEGNPGHPASLGATDLFAQASILDLYDPDRAQTVTRLGRIRTWKAFQDELSAPLQAHRALGGEGLRMLTGCVTSPSLGALLNQIRTEMPKAEWHQYEPIGHGSVTRGTQLAFGQPASLRYDFSRADVVVALDSDFLSDGAGSVRYAKDFMKRRRAWDGDHSMNRLYAVESATTNTGTLADHRLPMSAAEIGHFAVALAAAVGASGIIEPIDSATSRFDKQVEGIARDLSAHRGRSLVVAGRQAPAELHTVALAINHALDNIGSTLMVTDPVEVQPVDPAASLTKLVDDMSNGKVQTLLMLGGNPVYDAPANLDFVDALQNVKRRFHWGLYENETSQHCHWMLPAAHFLESWGDSRAFDGTVTLTQPLIEPLYGGKSSAEVVAMLTTAEAGRGTGEKILKTYWRDALGEPDFERSWRRSLHDGFVTDSALEAREVTINAAAVSDAARHLAQRSKPSVENLEIVFRADPTVYDGRFNNNAWLQECPKPLTKLTWENAAHISPGLAHARKLENGEVVELQLNGRVVRAPVWIHPGQPTHSVTVHLGYGRSRSGRVGTGAGFNAYTLRTSIDPWSTTGLKLQAIGEHVSFASTQLHSNIELDPRQGENLEGRAAEKRHLIRVGTLHEFEEHPEFAQHMTHGDDSLSLMPGYEYHGYAWGLSVDLSTCTGCNACVMACQAENNIPVVGKEQVALGREMHWIRIDRYYEGDLDEPSVHHQPVMCMHCEQAPCEVVCPVAATVHSDEGLNDMVYNRCVGTRYCSNNCPYKVRRFNFLKYNDTETPVLKLLRNPDVTVRSRGVMEKCSYCVQRINAARIESKKENRRIRDGEVQSACQQVCPTEAIVFGNVNDPESQVAKRKSQPLDYGLLSELGTRPRTTYLAKVRNPNDELAESAQSPHPEAAT